MNQDPIFLPFLAMMVLTVVVWFYMYSRRIPFIINNKLTPDQLTPGAFMKLSPPSVSNPADNLRNLFELPVLFYAVCLYLHLTSQVGSAYVTAAWVFVGFRAAHSVVHCTINVVIVRFWLYCIGALALWFMIVKAFIDALAS